MAIDFLMNLFGSSSRALSTALNTAVVMLGVWVITIDPITVTAMGWTYIIEPITIGEFTVLLSYYGIITGANTSIINHVPASVAQSMPFAVWLVFTMKKMKRLMGIAACQP